MQFSELPEQTLARHLSSDERLLWSGRPRQGIILRPSDAYMIPFSLMWGGFALFWEFSVLDSKAPGFFAIWGIPFVLIGLYMIIGRFFVDAWKRSKTVYGLTDQRVIILSGLFSSSIKSLQLRTLSDVSLSERSDGTGTITLGPQSPWWSGVAGWPGAGRAASPALEAIPRAREVLEQLRIAQRNA